MRLKAGYEIINRLNTNPAENITKNIDIDRIKENITSEIKRIHQNDVA